MSEVQTILDAVKDQYGIHFSEAMTGGGCMALEARLETGHWIVATDQNLMGFRERLEAEGYSDSYNAHYGEDHGAMGWMIGIIPDNDGCWMGGQESIVDIVDYDAYGADLPDMIGKALAAFVDKL